ncbi:MAG: glutaminyl-peptide cyclotransferase [Polyangiales bacterium]
MRPALPLALAVASCHAPPPPPTRAPVLTPAVLARHPHDPRAFTQGLEFSRGRLVEGTGGHGHSSLRTVVPETGEVLSRVDHPREVYGEGVTVFAGRIYQLTYRAGRCLVFDAETLAPQGDRRYPGEGWGLTHDDRSLILSDGTSALRFIDPETFAERGRLEVTDGGQPVARLNELERVGDEVYANVWRSNRVARIGLRDGRVRAWLDLSALAREVRPSHAEAVLNGVALHPETGDLWVTGKLWPTVFVIRRGP